MALSFLDARYGTIGNDPDCAVMRNSRYKSSRRHLPFKVAAYFQKLWTNPIFARWRQRLATDDPSLMAAGVAFFAFLALAPMIAAIALTYGLLANPDTLAARLDQIRDAFPADTASVLEEPIRIALERTDNTQGLALVVALFLAIFGARGAAIALIAALNRAYDKKESRPFVRLQLTALAVTAGLLVAIITSFALVSVSGLIGSAFIPAASWISWIVDIASTAIFVAMSAAVVASLYRWAPNCPSGRWRWISPGTMLTSVVWLILSSAFSAYATNIGRFGAAYGSLGAIVALLTWLYFSSLVLFAGASLNRAIEENQTMAVR